jgi:hypothetical protein
VLTALLAERCDSLLASDPVASAARAAAECPLQREVTAGPYSLDLDLVRRGTPLTRHEQLRRRDVSRGGRPRALLGVVSSGYTDSMTIGVDAS